MPSPASWHHLKQSITFRGDHRTRIKSGSGEVQRLRSSFAEHFGCGPTPVHGSGKGQSTASPGFNANIRSRSSLLAGITGNRIKRECGQMRSLRCTSRDISTGEVTVISSLSGNAHQLPVPASWHHLKQSITFRRDHRTRIIRVRRGAETEKFVRGAFRLRPNTAPGLRQRPVRRQSRASTPTSEVAARFLPGITGNRIKRGRAAKCGDRDARYGTFRPAKSGRTHPESRRDGTPIRDTRTRASSTEF
jgi:hypothetical protein